MWLDSQPTMSEASWQQHELARASEATASWAHRVTANQEDSRTRSLSSNRDDVTERRRVAPIGSRPNVLEDGSKLNPVNENFRGFRGFTPPAIPRSVRVRMAAKTDRRASSADSDASSPHEVRAAKRISLESLAERPTRVVPTASCWLGLVMCTAGENRM